MPLNLKAAAIAASDKSSEREIDAVPAISVKNLCKRFDNHLVLDNVNFDIAEGELLVMLGQSGSGKTTILRAIAGLEQPDAGDIFLKGRQATRLPAQKRNLGIVFQERNLFQRMTVAENIAFGLKLRGVAKAEIRSIVNDMLSLTQLGDHQNKYPRQLSGGQSQRVAVARALAYRPAALLFDEAFNALDPVTRVTLRREVRALLRALKIAALFITHDQEEALELGDRIAVLNRGRIEQIGAPFELYNHPHNEFVAAFLGAANILLGYWHSNEVVVGALRLKPPHQISSFTDHQLVKIIFRPEDVALDFQPQLLDARYYLGRGVVKDLYYIGPSERLIIELQNGPSMDASLNNQAQLRLVDDKACEGFPITVTRSKWRAVEMELSIGDQVAVGLKNFRALAHYPLDSEPAAKLIS